MSTRKQVPNTRFAMRDLIEQIRRSIPLDMPEAQVCSDSCNACSLKLLEYLAGELDDWEAKLDEDETPGLADLSQLARSARKIHRVLQKNGLIEETIHQSEH